MGDQDLDPLFVDPSTDNYSLQEDSPCIGTGRYGDDRGALPYVQTFIGNDSQTPLVFEIQTNYPNPFNAQTMIQYSLAKPGLVTITVYDILGREIENVLDQFQQAGYHSITWDAGEMSSGVYFYRITTGANSLTGHMTLIK